MRVRSAGYNLPLNPMSRFLIFCFLLIPWVGFSQTTVNLFMVEGIVNADNRQMPYFTFSTSGNFDSTNAVLQFNVGEEVTFNVTNETDFTCAFNIADHGAIDRIASGETQTLTVTFSEEGAFLYEDPFNDHRALGFGGLVVVSDFEGPEYFAVFTEHNEDWINPIADGGVYDKKSYHPDVFTLNGRSFPHTMRDSLAYILGNVGDTIRIHIANAGQMYHFPHFHGYHVKIVKASHHKNYEGWSKDSFGLAPSESMTLELVPDKPGRYPMHNHNLVTTTFGGNYPGGMMMHMHIYE